jgi:hypothetical protein
MSEKKLPFRLAAVLRVARLREQADRALLLSEARSDAEAERVKLERTAMVHVLAPPAAGPAVEFATAASLADLRARAAVDAAAARQAAADRLAAARDEWLRAARKVRSIEELEDRHHAAHAMVAARAAQRALDDLVKIRRARAAR